jgi:hypothetical protein
MLELDTSLRNANPLPRSAECDDDVAQTDALLLWIKQRSRIMHNTDRRTEHVEPTIPTFDPTDNPKESLPSGPRSRVRLLVAGIAFIAVLTAGAAVAFSMIAGTEPVATSREGAAALIGTTGVVVGGGQARSLPDAIRFAEDGTFEVVQDGDTIDNGVYQTEGDLITFKSEATHPVWENTPCQGGCVSESLRDMCREFVGEYRVTAQEASMFTLDLVWDECSQRLIVANGLQMEVLTE